MRIASRRNARIARGSEAIDPITQGTHERHVIEAERFMRKLSAKTGVAG